MRRLQRINFVFPFSLLISLFISLTVTAQGTKDYLIQLKSGAVIPKKNITTSELNILNKQLRTTNEKSYLIIQFEAIPAETEKQALLKEGIKLLEYIPAKAYVCEITLPLSAEVLKKNNARAIIPIEAAQKTDPSFTNSRNKTTAEEEVLVAFYSSFDYDTGIELLKKGDFIVLSDLLREYNITKLHLQLSRLSELASFPFIQYIEKAPPPPAQLNFNSRNLARANMLQPGLRGGYNLTGEGVVIGVYEVFGAPQGHIDFADRLLTGQTSTASNYHSTHVNGIVGGNGLINELYKGYAPKATLFSTGPSTLDNSFYLRKYGLVLTNNSYSTGGPCTNQINNIAEFINDKQAIDYPVLQNVFSAGNSGESICNNNYPPGFNTVLTGEISAKSSITVGSTYSNGLLSSFSSKGPTSGGKIKPEIVATGSSVISTIPNNNYGFNSGTSMSAPAVTGGLALMYQRYKQLNNGVNPSAGLMKAILCNTATDAGNPGPDFSYGFGQMHLLRAVQSIDSIHYFADSITNGETITKTIQVTPGTAQLKVLLYWQDPPKSLLSNRILVNDLDLSIMSPLGNLYLPYRLDTTSANVANQAARGEDHVNNIEQVVIDNPVPGNYQLKIRGTEIGENPEQGFFVTYDKLPDNVQLTFPSGGEVLVPRETITIQWDAWGQNNSGFTLAFSLDNGLTWQTISTSVASDTRQFDWQIPNTITTSALFKITRNADSKTSTSSRFIIIGTPAVSLSADQCPGAVSLQWAGVPGADKYEVMRVSNGEMIVLDTTSANSYTIRNLAEDSLCWVTVRSVINNMPGRRAVAISRKPDSGNCISGFFDNDLKADTLISPLIGRQFTSASFRQKEEIVFRIKNLDNQPAANYTVSYCINNGNWVIENVNFPVPAFNTYTYHFNTKYDFSQPGNYVVKLTVSNNLPDVNKTNDTAQFVISHLSNAPLDLSTLFIEKFEQARSNVYSNSFFGLRGIDKFDYNKIPGPGRVTFPINEMTDSSGKSLKFDFLNANDLSLHNQSVTGTFNLSAYDINTKKIALSFNFSGNRGCFGCPPDSSKLLIRGNDTLPWIEVMKLNPAEETFKDKKIEAINLGSFLAAAGQNYSSSFQIQWAHVSTLNSYLLDNVTLYDATNDMAVSFADTLPSKNCGLGTIPVKIRVSSTSRNNATNIQVYYKINSGNIVTETIPLINAGTSIIYTFITPANLSVYGTYTIETGVIYPNDSYPENNLKRTTIRNQPLIKTFPYLENFENSNGQFYVEGKNPSWEFGSPSSTLINKAASGNAAWKTNLAGKYNNDEVSYLYTPCFDYDLLQNAVISLSSAQNIDGCPIQSPIPDCDFMRLEYSTDGVKWTPFNPSRFRYNWPRFFTEKNYYRWHAATGSLPDTTGAVQFRFFFRTYETGNYEGVAIDDIHIYDRKMPIYDSILSGIPITQSVAGGNNWIEFLQDQKVIASINPYGQNLGNTTLKSYIKPIKPVSNFHGQYYLNRTFAISSENKNLTDSIGIRLYYLDSEADSLLFARNCINCSKPDDAYRLGISQYSTDSLSEENDSIPANINGSWSFIENRKIKIVPYDRGYYAEFKVKSLSEFRLNSGGPDKQSYLPVNLLSFSAAKSTSGITDLVWTVKSEINIRRYEIEVAKGNEAFTNNQFIKLGEVTSPGPSAQNRSYNFADVSAGKSGVLYYRLKIFDEFGNYSYSRAIPVLYSKELKWEIFPNPSNGFFTLQYQLPAGEKGTMNIYNSLGQMIKSLTIAGTGYVQTIGIDMKNTALSRGINFIKIITADSILEVFKVIIQ
jgi:Subtilase family/Secretion system C-terminal sorting domain